MTTYLLNSPVLTNFGDYRFEPIDVAAARGILAAGFKSAIGHETTAAALQTLFGLPVAFDRSQITMQPGDRAIVFRLKTRPAYGVELTVEDLLKDYELGLMTTHVASAAQAFPPSECSVFISYDRNNQKLAKRLEIDLKRAGIDAWLDQEGIKPQDPDWEATILNNVRTRRNFLLLGSPESVGSDFVQLEYEEAQRCGADVCLLHVSGDIRKITQKWQKPQLSDFVRLDYRDAFKQLLQGLAPAAIPPVNLFDLLSQDAITVEQAALELHGGKAVRFDDHRIWHRLPIGASGYSMAWLIAPDKDQMQLPARIGVLVKCSGNPSRDSLAEVLKHRETLREQCDEGHSSWVLYIEGHEPKQESQFELPLDAPHVWDDVANTVMRRLQNAPFKGLQLDFYFECPAALSFELGGRLRQMATYRVFQYDYSGSYQCVIKG